MLNKERENIMEEKIRTVTLTDDEGNKFELELVKEFEHSGKRYAVLYDGDACDCGDECNCEEGDCDGSIFIYEVVKNKDNKDEYKEITDEKIMKEIVDIAEKEIYSEE